MADMFALTLKAMGFDPALLLGQATQLGAAFERLVTGQASLAAQLERMEANQLAIMVHLGMTVPAPSGDMADLIAAESRTHIERMELAAYHVAAKLTEAPVKPDMAAFHAVAARYEGQPLLAASADE